MGFTGLFASVGLGRLAGRLGARSGAAAVLVGAGLLLAACADGPGTVCSGETVDTPWSDCGHDVIDDQPRLYTGEAPRKGPVIDPSRINSASAKVYSAPFTGYFGTMRVDYTPNVATVAQDVEDIRNASGPSFDGEEKVRVDLKDASIEYMLKQLIGGALKANYIAPAGLDGTVTFHTEEPIPKAQLIEVIRDILARENLAILYLNGVYHVGPPDLIQTLKQNGAIGRQGDVVVRTIPIKGGNANQLVQLANQIVPQTVKLLPSSDGNKVIVQATPAEADQVVDLLRGLATYGGDSNRVAVLPMSRADPQTVANQVSQFYQTQMPEVAGLATIIPLPDQQAILVGVRKPEMMPDLVRLISELDRNNAEPASLRIIPLQNISATEAADQLGKIFGTGQQSESPTTGGGGGGGGQGGGSGQGGGAASATAGMELGLQPQMSSAQPLADNEEDVGGDSRPPRVTLRPSRSGGSGSSSGSGRSGGSDQPIDNEGALDRVSQGFGSYGSSAGGGGGGGGGAAGSPRFVANIRTNSLMVFSTYEQYRQIRSVIETLDVPQSQVVIEATVLEVDLNDAIDKGVQFFLEGSGWSFRSAKGNSIAVPSGAGGVFTAGGDIGEVRADVIINALQSVTRTKVISSPYLTVMDGKTAHLNIGDQIPYTKTSQTSNNNGNVTVTQEIDIKDTGIILDVTPKVHADNSVELDVQQQVSTPSDTASTGDTTPIIATRNIQSDILVQSGRTALLGGLIQDRLERGETGVPLLRSLPVVGEAFKQNKDRVRRVELVVLITPRVVRQTSQLEDITRQLRAYTHTRPAVPVKPR